jgi:pimeloyl-ACP methyl ester carboxylesterase
MADAMPTAELHVVDGGHAPWMTQAERIAPVITDFLRRHGQPAA